MSLYDDIDTDKKVESTVAGWASGIKFLQSHMQLKKAAVTQPKRELVRKNVSGTLAPVVDFKAINNKTANSNNNTNNEAGTGDEESKVSTPFGLPYSLIAPRETKKKKGVGARLISSYLSVDPEWQFEGEYDPLYPNDYDKAVKEMRDRRDREAEEEETKKKGDEDRDRDRDDDRNNSRSRSERSGGAQIAPPPSLSQPSSTVADSIKTEAMSGMGGGGGLTAAARIMAKYGYKEGQGLGKKEQGMSMALQVEKTSHRIGRIIHERDIQKDVTVSNPFGLASSMAAYIDDEEEVQMDEVDPTAMPIEEQEIKEEQEPSLADILKNPSHVLLLKNMVGPGEVDDDLEPEVKEECTKYGLVNNVTVFQMPDVDSEDAIRIFVEFQDADSAVKGFMDLNGRFFGGRQVKASFYNVEKYNNLELTD